MASLGRIAQRDREGVFSVIASAAKQSIVAQEQVRVDCFVAALLAMTAARTSHSAQDSVPLGALIC